MAFCISIGRSIHRALWMCVIGGSAPPVVTNHILAENGNALITEAGDNLETES